MTGSDWKHRLSVARLATARSARRVGGSLRAPAIALGHAFSRRPSRLVIAPQDLRTADPTVANDIYAGHFSFAGRIVSAGGHSPFEIEPPSRGWAVGLYGFGWLRHLRAADTTLARAQARALMDDFLGTASLHPVGRETAVVARRLISLVSQSPLLLEGADHAFYRRYLVLLQRHVVRLKQAIAREPSGVARLQGAAALCYAALAFDRSDGLLHRATTLLDTEAAAQIRPDGGHISRNPRVVVDLLLDLLPLRQSFAARSMTQPPAMVDLVRRMLAHLRSLRHSEGSLALFHGTGAIPRDWLATLSVYDTARDEPVESAAESGYQRLESGPSVLVVDAGKPPPALHAGRAHASALAFELSSGSSRIFVNCGAPVDERAPLADAARSTAAHNAATFADTSSAVFASRGTGAETPIIDGPGEIAVSRQSGVDDVTLTASHDGYRAAFGVVHRRRLSLQSGGLVLEGEDEFEGTPTGARDDVAIRFHLLPGTRTDHLAGKQGVLLVLPDGQAWRFDAGGLDIEVEESIFFAAGNTPRRSEQLVVNLNIRQMPGVTWRLVRVRDPQERTRTAEAASEPPAPDAPAPDAAGRDTDGD